MTDRPPLKDLALGRWPGILRALGFTERTLNGKNGPCPICDGGKDRFKFDDKEGRGTWICSHCGAGDGFSLVMKARGVDFRGAAQLIEPLVGTAPASPVKQQASEEECRRWRNEAWQGARPITVEDAAGLYLHARVGLVTFPRCLRFHPALDHRDGEGVRSRHPAMLARVTAPDGTPANVHRTWLSATGGKAPVLKPRMMMPGVISEGSAVRLVEIGSEPVDELGIAEGIETALAATALHGVPCWAAISAGPLAKWRPPANVRKVIVFADADSNYVGQNAAYQLANRLVVREKLDVDVRAPGQIGTDWDDVYMAQKREPEHA